MIVMMASYFSRYTSLKNCVFIFETLGPRVGTIWAYRTERIYILRLVSLASCVFGKCKNWVQWINYYKNKISCILTSLYKLTNHNIVTKNFILGSVLSLNLKLYVNVDFSNLPTSLLFVFKFAAAHFYQH